MKQLQEDDEDAYGRQFKRYVDSGINADGLEALYTKAHAEIRKNPTKPRDAKELGRFGTRSKPKAKDEKFTKKRYNKSSISLAQRKGRITQVLTARGVKSIAPKKTQA